MSIISSFISLVFQITTFLKISVPWQELILKSGLINRQRARVCVFVFQFLSYYFIIDHYLFLVPSRILDKDPRLYELTVHIGLVYSPVELTSTTVTLSFKGYSEKKVF